MEEKEVKCLDGLLNKAYCKCLISQDEFYNLSKELYALIEAKCQLDSRKMKPKFLVGEEVYALEYKNALEPVVTKILIESSDYYEDKKQFHYNYRWYEENLFRSLEECKTEMRRQADKLHEDINAIIDGIIKFYKEKEGDN